MGDIYRSFLRHLVQKGIVNIPSNESISDMYQMSAFQFRMTFFNHICGSDDGPDDSPLTSPVDLSMFLSD